MIPRSSVTWLVVKKVRTSTHVASSILSLPLKPQGLNRLLLREKNSQRESETAPHLRFSYFLHHWVLEECSESLLLLTFKAD